MSEILDFFKNLFNKEDKPSNPFIHEVISRSDEEEIYYHNWKRSPRKDRAMEFLRMEYQKNVAEENFTGATFYTINAEAMKGFQLHYRPDIFSINEFQYLFDYLKERVMNFDYRPYISDVRTYVKENTTECIERHYLKPRLKKDTDNRFVHLFGNITILHEKINEQPSHIKFIANTYQDRKYTAPEKYKNLIEHVLQ